MSSPLQLIPLGSRKAASKKADEEGCATSLARSTPEALVFGNSEPPAGSGAQLHSYLAGRASMRTGATMFLLVAQAF